MSYTNKTEKFLIIRSLILILSLVGLSQIIYKFDFAILLGLIIGYFVGILRLRTLTVAAHTIFSSTNKKNKGTVLKYILVQIVTILALAIAIKVTVPFFFAVSVGVLTVPITIMINSFTEFLGATRNNFQ
jgi:hypothetical protein